MNATGLGAIQLVLIGRNLESSINRFTNISFQSQLQLIEVQLFSNCTGFSSEIILVYSKECCVDSDFSNKFARAFLRAEHTILWFHYVLFIFKNSMDSKVSGDILLRYSREMNLANDHNLSKCAVDPRIKLQFIYLLLLLCIF